MTKIHLIAWWALAAPALLLATTDIPWYTIDGGGDVSSGGAFTVTGTAGQPDATAAGASTGGDYTLAGGFWPVILPVCTAFAPADFNQDCVVDATDFAIFQACVSGPAILYGADCAKADFDHDGDVDQTDFGVFQRCYSGPGNPADPNCAN